ncbi:MAG: hypothetical protein ABIU06_02860 [Anaerolineales bacterium]
MSKKSNIKLEAEIRAAHEHTKNMTEEEIKREFEEGLKDGKLTKQPKDV